jgi:hypothetical protein
MLEGPRPRPPRIHGGPPSRDPPASATPACDEGRDADPFWTSFDRVSTR